MVITKETIDKARAWYSGTPTLKLQSIELRDYQVEIGSGGIRLDKGRWQEAVNHRIPTMTGEQIQAATRGVQASIMAFWKGTPEFPRVMRALGAVQFLARCKKAATAFRREKAEA